MGAAEYCCAALIAKLEALAVGEMSRAPITSAIRFGAGAKSCTVAMSKGRGRRGDGFIITTNCDDGRAGEQTLGAQTNAARTTDLG